MSNIIINRTSLLVVAEGKKPEKDVDYIDDSTRPLKDNNLLMHIHVMWDKTQKEGKIIYGIPYEIDYAAKCIKVGRIFIDVPHSYTVLKILVNVPRDLVGFNESNSDIWVSLQLPQSTVGLLKYSDTLTIEPENGILVDVL